MSGERVDMNFGNPIDISDIRRMNDAGIAEVASRIQAEFDRLDAENDTYRTAKMKRNPLTLLYRIPLGIIALVAVFFTLLFSFIASFVWDPARTVKKP